jgi:hypothetical protein
MFQKAELWPSVANSSSEPVSRVMPVPVSQRGPSRSAIRPAAGDEHNQHVPGRKVAPL